MGAEEGLGDFSQVLLGLLIVFCRLLVAVQHLLLTFNKSLLSFVVGLLQLQHTIHKVGGNLRNSVFRNIVLTVLIFD